MLADVVKELRLQAHRSERAEELNMEADTLERAAEWMGDPDPGLASPSMLKMMHYDSHAARRRRHAAPGPKSQPAPPGGSDPTHGDETASSDDAGDAV
jgi:hypothetical protein